MQQFQVKPNTIICKIRFHVIMLPQIPLSYPKKIWQNHKEWIKRPMKRENNTWLEKQLTKISIWTSLDNDRRQVKNSRCRNLQQKPPSSSSLGISVYLCMGVCVCACIERWQEKTNKSKIKYNWFFSNYRKSILLKKVKDNC